MADLTITVPDALLADVQAAIRRIYGSEAVGLTGRQLLILHLRRSLRPSLQALRQAGVSMDAEVAARQAAEAALRAETDARAAAVAEAVTQAAADLEGVV